MTITVGPNLGILINGDKGEEHYAHLMRQWRALDGLVQPVVITMGATVPPSTNADGDMHIVGAGATGAWSGMDNRLARYFTVGVGAPAWEFFAPKAGWQARVLSQLDTDGLPRTAGFNGTSWALVSTGGGSSEVPVVDIADLNYDLDSSHNGSYLRMTATGPASVTVRQQSVHALPDNGVWHIRNSGDGDLTIVPSGVLINLPAGGSYTVPVGGTISIKRVTTDEFDLLGQTNGSGGGGSAEVPVVTVATSNYDVDADHNNCYIRMTASGALTVTVRTEADHPLPANGVWHIRNSGDADATISGAVGVTINVPAGGSLVVPAGGTVSIKRTAADVFDLMGQTVGDGAPVSASDFASSAAYLTFDDNAGKVRLNVNESGLATAIGLDSKLDASLIGEADGVAPLDENGRVPSGNLPSYVDDVLEFASLASFPEPGESGKIYIAIDTNRQYRWSGSAYVEIVASPGTTDNVPEGTTNLYHTPARVRSSALTGFVAGVGFTAVIATDTIIQALQKIQGWLSSLGTASQANLVASNTDTTSGRVPTVGWMGAGARSIPVDAGGTLSTNQVSGFYNYTNHGLPLSTAVGGITVQILATTDYTVSYLGRNGRFFGVTRENGNQSSCEFWTDANLVKTTSANDTTAGRVLTTGYAGLLSDVAITYISNSTDNNDRKVFALTYAQGEANRPDWVGEPTAHGVFTLPITATRGIQLLFSPANGVNRVSLRTYSNSNFAAWGDFYTTGNTSADVQTMLSSADNAAIRSNIGAGTSNLTIGTTAGTAKAGDYQPAAANISDSTATGRSVLTASDSAAARSAISAAKKTVLVAVSAASHNIDAANESVYHRFTFSGAKTATVRPNSTHALPADGSWVLRNANTGNLTIVEGSGVTINPPYGGTLVLEPGMTVTLQKVGTNEYDLIGQTVPA